MHVVMVRWLRRVYFFFTFGIPIYVCGLLRPCCGVRFPLFFLRCRVLISAQSVRVQYVVREG